MRGNVYVLFGAGANITFSVGFDGALLVDAGRAEMTDKVIAAVRAYAARVAGSQRSQAARIRRRDALVGGRPRTSRRRPSRFATSSTRTPTPSTTGGNEQLRNAGRTFTGGNVAGNIADAGEGAAILAHENVLKRLSAPAPTASRRRIPTRCPPTPTSSSPTS